MSRAKRARGGPQTGFALILWFIAFWMGVLATGGFRFGPHWPLLLWFLPAAVLVKVGADLWRMGKPG